MAAYVDSHHSRSSSATATSAEGEAPAGATLLSFYVRALREVFARSSRGSGFLFFVASLLHAFGHAALAVVAGECTVLLAGRMDADPSRRLRTALLLGSMGFLAALAKACGGALAAYGQARIASRVGGTLRLSVLDRWFARYRLRRPRQTDHGQTRTTPALTDGAAGIPVGAAAHGVSALTVQVREVETGLSQGLLAGGRAIAQLIPLAAALVWISPRLALAAALVLTPFAFALSRVRRGWKSAHRAAAREGEALLEAADEAVRHADLWVAYSAEAKARTAVGRLSDLLGRREAGIQAAAAAMSGANEVLGALALVLVLAAAAAGWLGDVGDSGRLLAFTVCFFLAYRPIRDLTEARLAWSRASLSFDELRPTTAPASATDAATPAKEWPLDELDVTGLVLPYGSRAPVSFRLLPGETVAIVGPTGEGKTTLVRTLLGLDVPEAGDVRYGGASIVAAPPGLVHRPFAWSPQDAALLADTLDANASLGSVASTEDVRRVLALLGAEHVADAAGAERLGPGGVVLSGGERQWVALARALATRQPILVLDEPTSSLDPDARRAVLSAIASVRGARSVLLVTHQSEPLLLADVVVRFEGGEVTVSDGPRRVAPRPGVS